MCFVIAMSFIWFGFRHHSAWCVQQKYWLRSLSVDGWFYREYTSTVLDLGVVYSRHAAIRTESPEPGLSARHMDIHPYGLWHVESRTTGLRPICVLCQHMAWKKLLLEWWTVPARILLCLWKSQLLTIDDICLKDGMVLSLRSKTFLHCWWWNIRK